ncbi:MAG: GNAT family N-acetyltransferase [Prevotellaceae bacterium]|jgi:GNAT superfamily N-acetyltransferase|nr:GNAT family N-acetyltransferase [Prevotellaceae bacterium]
MVSNIKKTTSNLDIVLTRSVYEAAFAPEHRRNFEDLLEIARTKRAFNAEIFKHTNELLGFIFYWKFPNFVYVEHFAIAERLRNRGFGGEFFRDFCQATTLPIILEVEKPDSETNKRRIRFYENCGFKISETPYIQPAYNPKKTPVPMLLMFRGEMDVEKSVETIKSEVYGQ